MIRWPTDGCAAQYVVADLRSLMDGLIIPESMCNPSRYAVLQGAKKVTNYFTGAPKTPRIVFLLRWWSGGADGMYVKPIFYSHGLFYLLISNGDFMLQFPR